jgi:hypothetical protein
MGSALWGSLKASDKQPPTNIVNADIIVTEEIHDGTTKKTVVHADTTPAPGARVKFKPVDQRTATTAKAISEAPPSDHTDLVGDDIGAAPSRQPKGAAGRPRLHSSNAQKQRAYRERMKAGG